MEHIPVLLNEVIEQLSIKPDGIYVDLTLGRGGHSQEILKRLTTGKLICFDKDIQAINESREKLIKISQNFILIKSDFRNITCELKKLNIDKVDGILADLGVSSPQLDDPNRGFSYSINSDLDMRMDLDNTLTAKEIINNATEKEIIDILQSNADVKLSNLIAKAIVKNRPISDSFTLNQIIKDSLPAKIVRQKNPSKAVFQAFRIAVNDELNALSEMLSQLPNLLKKDGKIAIITFHSKEDVIVKKFYQNLNYFDPKLKKILIVETHKWHQKVIFPSSKEEEINKRSRSAKLRVITKLMD
ncbi:16S rRNA (cytosine(1402)-N(4))-methyltransferase RsmH [Metamycoplasma hominis]|uniref:Ribosomal RNA small subunit methyltransferase H n=3 Tax=Metamycoplasma hominis TaxID=2098 RepID=D1J816_METH1|nr:16S rRNA (cytosine(1402)-N(4))-methyltransferase RsmH [Metamycoplasma hominis]AIU33993.1 ribosomal RNA small subunit methyltransferase H [Metamycoplasma hominis ATCC 27545]AUW37081.1 16S rRNA (cytosine(1402)-N(4))-methyltransferase RsmH [Metamycoplasma hominis]AYN65376.1 16S rRNA (cytosine(1402)-N(4))-methyltransferase RsmH [Metamycoplasma hominis]KGF61754.1 16S rRNA methyltransferase [Metamycoplasma hominis]MCF1354853.1 16S rRNA (cytosine(1402)-N(4))-methyltransferase RsmH [Metamycoplasma 